MEKLASVKLALDERRLQLQQLVVNDTRPRTAFLRTPAHIRALYDSVCRTAVDLRHRLDTSCRDISSADRSQLTALVSDLERELDVISRRLELVYRQRSPAPPSQPPPISTVYCEPEMTSFPLPSRLPPLGMERSTVDFGAKRTRTLLLRHNAALMQRQSVDADTRNYQCYPRGSSFPKLAPVPRCRFVTRKPSWDAQNESTSCTAMTSSFVEIQRRRNHDDDNSRTVKRHSAWFRQ